MSQANSQPPATTPKPQVDPRVSPASTSPVDDDPLLHLHRMSTTAGLGSTDYVAVNTLAVVAVLFGVGSLLAMLDNLLLVVPVVGVVVALVAMRQVADSNGTQTGGGLALAGLLLSAGITSFVLSKQVTHAAHLRADKQAIGALCEQFGQMVRDKKFEPAYELFDDTFKARVRKNDFVVHLDSLQRQSGLGSMDSIAFNGLAEFSSDRDSGVVVAEGGLRIHFTAPASQQTGARFEKIEGKWYFDNVPDLFPQIKPKTPGAPGGGSGGPMGPAGPGGPPGQ